MSMHHESQRAKARQMEQHEHRHEATMTYGDARAYWLGGWPTWRLKAVLNVLADP